MPRYMQNAHTMRLIHVGKSEGGRPANEELRAIPIAPSGKAAEQPEEANARGNPFTPACVYIHRERERERRVNEGGNDA